MNGPTEAQMFDIFEGPVNISQGTDWLLPQYQQPNYVSQFPAGTFSGYLPEPAPRTGAWDWLTPVAQPFVKFGQSLYKEAVEPAVTQTYEKLPELLWGWGLDKAGVDRPREIVVDEGAGVVVTHTQPPQIGGAPAKPITTSIPQTFTPWMMPQLKDKDTVLWIGAGVIVLYVLFRGKGK